MLRSEWDCEQQRLGHRLAMHYNFDGANGVDANDPWYYFVYDDSWRIVAVFRGSDTSPKEQFVYHTSGSSGWCGSSYLDSVILRDKDNNSGWANPADGSLEQRHHYCQNWRYDVIAMVSNTGKIIERCRYFANGQPFSSPPGDTNFDGLVGSADNGNVLSWYSSYNVAGDFDLDGDVDAGDLAEVTVNWGTTAHGFGKLSNYTSGYNGNRKGYAGYEYDFVLQARSQFWHVRNRVLSSELGRWLQRDPAGYVDGANLYPYVMNNPLAGFDPFGLECCSGGIGIGGGTNQWEGPPIVVEQPEAQKYCAGRRMDPNGEIGDLPEFGVGMGVPIGLHGSGQPAYMPPVGGERRMPRYTGGDRQCGCDIYDRTTEFDQWLACRLGCKAGNENANCAIRCSTRFGRGTPEYKQCMIMCRIARGKSSNPCLDRYNACILDCQDMHGDCRDAVDSAAIAAGIALGALALVPGCAVGSFVAGGVLAVKFVQAKQDWTRS
jgi:RHS repeat-associated protein